MSYENATHGWVVGSNAQILHSSDGGETYAQQPSGLSSDTVLRDVVRVASGCPVRIDACTLCGSEAKLM